MNARLLKKLEEVNGKRTARVVTGSDLVRILSAGEAKAKTFPPALRTYLRFTFRPILPNRYAYAATCTQVDFRVSAKGSVLKSKIEISEGYARKGSFGLGDEVQTSFDSEAFIEDLGSRSELAKSLAASYARQAQTC